MTAAAAIVAGGALLGYVASGVGSTAAAAFVVAAAVLALVAVLAGVHERFVGDSGWALAVAPATMVLYFSFNAGGFFPGSQAFVTLLLALCLALRIALVPQPFAGFNRWVAGVALALALYVVLIAWSASWSHSTGRALIETNRALLYLLAFVLFASIPRTGQSVRWMLRGLAVAVLAVCVVAAISRLLPNVWPTQPDVGMQRLSYPLTYWNALALLAALGAVLCVHLTSTLQERAAVSIAAAGALPLLATTIYLTFSRGGVAAVAIGVAVYLLVARPRGVVGGLVAVVPASAVAVATAYDSAALAGSDFTSAAAVSDGKHVATVLGACILGACVIRALARPVDARIDRLRLPTHLRRPMTVGAWAGTVCVVLVVALALGAPAAVSRQYHRFVNGDQVVSSGADLRQRLTDPGNNHRLSHWRVAVDAWHTEILHGTGAGTYDIEWAKRRKTDFTVRDAHSLYVETLGELGVVGFVLLVGALLTIAVRIAIAARGRRRSLYGAVFALVITWGLHAGVDWDWEMPAVTVATFCLAGAVLATSARVDRDDRPWRLAPRLVAVAAVMAVALLPSLTAVSDNRLSAASQAFAAGDCAGAEKAAHDSLSALGSRPEPYELVGYCAITKGDGTAAVAAMRSAVDRDPGDAEYRYGLSLARAAAGQDPRGDIRAALERDPLNQLYQGVARGFTRVPPDVWPKIGQEAPLPPEF